MKETFPHWQQAKWVHFCAFVPVSLCVSVCLVTQGVNQRGLDCQEVSEGTAEGRNDWPVSQTTKKQLRVLLMLPECKLHECKPSSILCLPAKVLGSATRKKWQPFSCDTIAHTSSLTFLHSLELSRQLNLFFLFYFFTPLISKCSFFLYLFSREYHSSPNW